MNCPYCHAFDGRTCPATQHVTFWKDSFGIQRKNTRAVCDQHASYLRLTYHVEEAHDLMSNDVSYADYRAAVTLLFYGPEGWIALPTEDKRISLRVMLAACNGAQKYQDQITACLTIARYEGIDLTTDTQE